MTRKACALTLSALMVATVLLCAAPTGVAAAGSAGTPQGTFMAWGTSHYGQLGSGTNDDSNIPIRVSDPSSVATVAAGEWHSLAIMSDGTVRAWGWNGRGQLGNGTNTDSNTPVEVSGLSGVIAVSAGGSHNLALKSDGTVMSWGYNLYGQLGNGSNIDSNTPVQVSGLSGVVAVSAGGRHSLALLGNRTVVSWGYNGEGELGNGTNGPGTDTNTPVGVPDLSGVVAISAGYYHSLVKMSDGTAMSWGSNDSGRLGNGTNVDSNIPVQVSGLSGVVAVSAGAAHSLTKMSDGAVRSWGSNGYGQLGDGSNNDSNTPVEVSGLSGVEAVSAGGGHSLAKMSDGTVRSWGYNNDGQLGDGTNNDSNTPVEVYGNPAVAAVSAGGWHCLALSAPTVTTLNPNHILEGSPGFTMTVNGTGFASDSIVRWNGNDRTTTYVSDTVLEASIPSGDAASAGSVQVTVFNPVPTGGTSNTERFIVDSPAMSITEYAIPTDDCSARDITEGPDGALWFAEVYTKKIGRITTTGSVTEYMVPSIASGPFGITSGPDGALWYTKWFDNMIGRITTAGAINEYLVPTDGGSPRDITSGPDGALWFVELYGNKIGRITTGGAITEYTVPTADSLPFQITAGPDGALWFTEYGSDKIGRITTAGTITEYDIPTSGCMAFGITPGPDGALWFTESATASNKIGRITTAGTITEYDIPTTDCMPLGIASGPDGALWFTESNSDKIGRITVRGAIREYDIPTADGHPFGITLGPDGTLWFAESSGNQIGKIVITKHAVNASVSGGHGTVTPLDQTLYYGGTATINITPDAHYRIKKITVDGSDVPSPVSPYTFTNVTADHTITAEFEMITHSITVTQGAHGNITPAGTAGVVSENDGADQAFTIKPDPNYHVADVVVDGSSVGPATSYTLHNITANHAVTASFASDSSTWYLAEGSTAWGFDCYISIENPNTDAVHATITYMTSDGNVSGGTVTLPAMSQATVNPAEKLGGTDFSTKVTCTENKAICCDRTMSWIGTGAASPEGHSSVGVTSPARTWYLPEGSSAWGFECWLLIQNPNSTAATTRVTYMIEGAGPVIKTRTVPANSRKSFNIGDDIGARDASIKVTSNVPVIPERAMYRDNKREGHDSVGTTAAASDYYLAEGSTAWGFTTYLLIQNPSSAASTVTVTYMTPTGKKVQPSFSLPGNSRKTIKVNDVAGMANTDFSTQVHGAGPIIAERAMYWDNGTGEACHDSIGMATPHTTFYFPDGRTAGGRETWITVLNPNSSAVGVEIAYLKAGGGAVTLSTSIPANSRKTFNMADKVSSGSASIMVTSKTAGKKIMCERAMYWNNRGAGTNTIGGYSD